MSSEYVLEKLTDDALIARLKLLVAKNNQLTAVLLAHLGEVDARKLFAGHGCSSMHSYCTEVLHFSEGAAYKRIQAARAARKYPALFELVATGALHLSGIAVLAPELTAENHGELFAQASGKSKRAIEELVRARAPKPDLPQMIRKLPCPPPPALFSAGGLAAPAAALIAPPKPAPLPVLAPLAQDRFKLQVTVSRELKEKIDTAKALLRHQLPDGDLEAVLGHAVDALLEKLMRKKFAATPKPKSEPGQSEKRTRHIPAAVKRRVAERDGLQCTFVSADGRRCTERGFLEFDHAQPYAKRGAHTVENLRLRCRSHNAYHAELEYGVDHMRKKIELSPGTAVHENSCPKDQLFLTL